MITLDYFRPDKAQSWVTVARCATVAQWHNTRHALLRNQIECRMKSAPDDGTAQEAEMELLVRFDDVEKAQEILAAFTGRRVWCPHCASTSVRELRVKWHWYLLAAVCIGFAPYWPPSNRCRNCGHEF